MLTCQALTLKLVVHNLVVRLDAKLVNPKLYKMHPQIALLVKVELQKMLDFIFIKPIDYPEWVSNVVPVGKFTGA